MVHYIVHYTVHYIVHYIVHDIVHGIVHYIRQASLWAAAVWGVAAAGGGGALWWARGQESAVLYEVQSPPHRGLSALLCTLAHTLHAPRAFLPPLPLLHPHTPPPAPILHPVQVALHLNVALSPDNLLVFMVPAACAPHVHRTCTARAPHGHRMCTALHIARL